MRAVIFCILGIALPGVVFSADYFGAITYSDKTRAHGWAKDYPDRAGAEKAALGGCAKHADDCRVVLWFKNGCGALATGPRSGVGWDWAEEQATADRRAINACARQSSACTIKQRVCTTK